MISVLEEAHENGLPEKHYYRATCLNSLGNALQTRFERMGTLADLNKAVSIKEEGINIMAVDHTYRGSRLRGGGRSLASF